MPLFAYFVLAIALSAFSILPSTDRIRRIEANQADELRGALMVYAGRLASFRASNPTYAGAVPDSALQLPDWFRKPPTMGNIISGGQAFVYVTGLAGGPPDATGFFQGREIAPRFGIVRSGNAVSIVLGVSLGALPSLPEGSIVYAP